jgi:hypothetical protein
MNSEDPPQNGPQFLVRDGRDLALELRSLFLVEIPSFHCPQARPLLNWSWFAPPRGESDIIQLAGSKSFVHPPEDLHLVKMKFLHPGGTRDLHGQDPFSQRAWPTSPG